MRLRRGTLFRPSHVRVCHCHEIASVALTSVLLPAPTNLFKQGLQVLDVSHPEGDRFAVQDAVKSNVVSRWGSKYKELR